MPEYDDTDDRPRKRPWEGGGRDDEDDRPRRPRRRDEFDDRPASGGTNGLAVAGLILGVLGFCTAGLAALPGLVCSAIALGKPNGRGLAIAGLVVSGAGMFLGGIIAIGLLLPAVQKTREAAARMKDSNSLKQIGLAAHSFSDANAKLPPADGPVSWRVHLLPYVEQQALYQRFNLQQPWDGPTNKPLAAQRVPVYLSAADGPDAGPDTRYRVFVGPGALYDPELPRPWTIRTVPDGTSNTFFAVEAGDAVPWPQPKELAYDRGAPLPPLGYAGRKVFLVAMLDGSVRSIAKDTAPAVLRAGIEAADGQPFDP